ncbi:hemerythrin domain-containing protein [Ramlibacter sp. AN1133]|uniref:hemerythrin domain-containing protein n=1 Tax=Ramlibacter sp. AN1133 TaxID=3133429 RepID=UPI0030C01327
MAYTDNFRRQHQELLTMVGDIVARLKAQPADAHGLRNLLSALAGKLTVHLAMEDKALYPRLADVDVENSRSISLAFQQEMGGLAGVFTAYNQKWQLEAIAADPAGFARDSHSVFAAIGRRIARENNELYPLADRAL